MYRSFREQFITESDLYDLICFRFIALSALGFPQLIYFADKKWEVNVGNIISFSQQLIIIGRMACVNYATKIIKIKAAASAIS